jgi:hypothetical protein
MKKSAIILVIFLLTKFSFASKNFILHFTPQYNKQIIAFNKSNYSASKKDTITFDLLKFYISGIRFVQKGKTVFTEQNSFHLLDAEKLMNINISLPENLQFDEVKFNFGIDSITNNAGVGGGDLDPTNGMYWTWQSGYINFKLEGKCSNNILKNKSFIYHLGGFSFPNNTCREVNIPVRDKNSVDVIIDFDKFFAQDVLSQTTRVMSPGKDAVRLSTLISECIYTKP